MRAARAPMPAAGDHGGDGARVAAALGIDPAGVLDLSASMNPVAPDPAPVVARHVDAVGRYPDPEPATAALASAMGVDQHRLLLTNGGAEAIALLGATTRRGWIDEPDFSLYARHLAVIDRNAPRWRSDPHNPTGLLAGAAEVAAVWDEAFYPLATGRWTSGRADGGAVVLGSLTKLFACPGLRIGYVLVPPGESGADLGARLATAQPRWALNGLASACLAELLATADLRGWAAEVVRLRTALVAQLVERGFVPRPSESNYVLVPDAGGLRGLLAGQAVVVRDCASFGLVDHVRIAVPDDDGRARLMTAIDTVAPRWSLR